MVTCYDFSSAKIVEQSQIHCILVGDSVAMVIHGHESTIAADMPMMIAHTTAVRRGYSGFIVGDMPFLSYRLTTEEALSSMGALLKAGANAVKVEGARGNLNIISRATESGIPVMGHLGLTPQSINSLGGYKVQGKSSTEQEQLLEEAISLEKAGCFALVLECVPTSLGKRVSEELTIPVIGIGAGSNVDGQVLVFHDLLGLSSGHEPRFVRKFSNVGQPTLTGLDSFHSAVQSGDYPSPQESYQ